MTHLLLKRSAAAARGRQGASIDKAGKAGNSPPSCDGHHSGASQSELIHTPKLAFSSRARTLPRFPAGLFFCAALTLASPINRLCSLFVRRDGTSVGEGGSGGGVLLAQPQPEKRELKGGESP